MNAIRRTGLALFLAFGAMATTASAFQAKEPTDGFFDIPVDPNAPEKQSYGVPAYLVTSALAGAGIFVLCKSARR